MTIPPFEETRSPSGTGRRGHWIRGPKAGWTAGVALGVSLFAAGAFFGYRAASRVSPNSESTKVPGADQRSWLKPGPWGDVECVPIYIEPPEQYIAIQATEAVDSRWLFRGYSASKLGAFLGAIHLPADQKAELLDPTRCLSATNGVIVTPSRKLIVSLSPEHRKQIYRVLSQSPENPIDKLKLWFPANSFDEHFAHSGLARETIDLVRRLSFPQGKLLVFCDSKAVLETINSYKDKVRLMKALRRKRTMLLKLHVTPETDLDSLLDYWAKAAKAKDLRPLLESLASVPGGDNVNLALVLPKLPAANLYTFPFPSLDPTEQHKDCHWTSFNFFRDPPDPRFTDLKFVAETIQRDYYPVFTDPRYGDIVALENSSGNIIHSAVYIADDIAYTKNGPHFSEPFLFMTIPDLVDLFSGLLPEGQQLRVAYFRNKYY